MSVLETIGYAVRDANLGRNRRNLDRRTLKLIEEIGEVSQAYLNVTSPSNPKGFTWNDVREELADVLIVALDIGWTKLLNDPHKDAMHEHISDTPTSSEPFDDVALLGLTGYVGDFVRSFKREQFDYVLGSAIMMNWQVMPDQRGLPLSDLEIQLQTEVFRKLAKWSANRANMTVVTDDV